MAKRITFELPPGWGERLIEDDKFTILAHNTERVLVYSEPPQPPCVEVPGGLFYPDDVDELIPRLKEAVSIARQMTTQPNTTTEPKSE